MIHNLKFRSLKIGLKKVMHHHSFFIKNQIDRMNTNIPHMASFCP